MVDFRTFGFLAAAVATMAVALIALFRGGPGPVPRQLSALSLAFFVVNFSAFGNRVFPGTFWRPFDAAATALTPAFALGFSLAFVGRARAGRPYFRLLLVACGVLCAVSLHSLAAPAGARWIELPGWSVAFFVLAAFAAAPSLVLLIVHAKGALDGDERARTVLCLMAFLVGGSLGSTDVLADVGVPVPMLSPWGFLASSALLAVAAFRFRLLGQAVSVRLGLSAVALAVSVTIAFLGASKLLEDQLPALLFGLTLAALLVAFTFGRTALLFFHAQQRSERFLLLGRFAAQMAHDLKNPLAAVVGAADVLQSTAPRSPEQEKMIALIAAQAERMRVVIDSYRRLGCVEPVRTTTAIAPLLDGVAASARIAFRDKELTIRTACARPDASFALDADLVTEALENLVRNACEATRLGGTVTLTAEWQGDAEGATLSLCVVDDGVGMDPRQAEHAGESMVSTKPTGSGLGLTFVRQVALAHGGTLRVSSRIAVGTTVRLLLPAPRGVESET